MSTSFPLRPLAIAMLLANSLTTQASEWALVNPHPTPERLWSCLNSSVAGKYLAAGASGTLIVSNDGQSWSASEKLPMAWTDGTRAMAEGGNTLVAVGSTSNTVFTSSDGLSWVAQSTGSSGTLTDVMWDGSRFLATDQHLQSVHSSPDGVSWSEHPTGAGQVLNGIAWNGATYIIVGRAGIIMSSTDLTAWTARTSGTTNILNSVTWSATLNLFVAVGDGGTLLSSTDGIAWSNNTTGNTAPSFQKVLYDGSRFITIDGSIGRIYTSDNGTTWTSQLDQPGETTRKELNGICFDGGQSLVVGGGGLVMRSTNGSDWTKQTPDLNPLNNITHGPGSFIAVGTAAPDGTGQVLKSPNGVNWSSVSVTGFSSWLNGVVWADSLGLYVAVGDGGAIFTSLDGTTWNAQTSNTIEQLYGIAWDGTHLVASGDYGVIRVSTDGITWDIYDIPSFVFDTVSNAGDLYVYYLGGKFVAVGYNKPAYSSPDGMIWTKGNVDNMGYSSGGLGWDGLLYTTGLYTSPDGLTWSPTVSNLPYRTGITHDGTQFIGVGAAGSIFNSLDGSLWSEALSSPTMTHLKSIVKLGGTSVMVGDNGAIFFSSAIQLTESGGVTAIIEGGSGDSYEIVLTSPPSADVVIALTPESGAEVSPTSLTFTSANWSTPQVVTVTATDDKVANGNRTRYISHAVSSADTVYNSTAVADVAVGITDNDSAPVANAANGSGDEDNNILITLSATDADGDPLTYAVVDAPAHGAVQILNTQATYIPNANYHGSDSFTYVANDGWNDSATANVSVTINSVNDAPVANSTSGSGDMDADIIITLSATDADGDGLTYRVVAQPTHGSVIISGTIATYTPDSGYSGSDSFTYVANDGTIDSSPASVTLTINSTPVTGGSGGGGGGGAMDAFWLLLLLPALRRLTSAGSRRGRSFPSGM